MFHIERMQEHMRGEVLPMVKEFYQSDAVSHPVEVSVLERTFADAVSEDPVVEGQVLMEDERIVGFGYTTIYYACEAGGRCMMFEELFLKEEARGKGYGSRYFQEMLERHPEVRRFRLEVSRSNEAAVRLYERLGFSFLEYDQMALDSKAAKAHERNFYESPFE